MLQTLLNTRLSIGDNDLYSEKDLFLCNEYSNPNLINHFNDIYNQYTKNLYTYKRSYYFINKILKIQEKTSKNILKICNYEIDNKLKIIKQDNDNLESIYNYTQLIEYYKKESINHLDLINNLKYFYSQNLHENYQQQLKYKFDFIDKKIKEYHKEIDQLNKKMNDMELKVLKEWKILNQKQQQASDQENIVINEANTTY